MPTNNRYPIDDQINSNDLLFGSDEVGRTRNFTIADLTSYFTRTVTGSVSRIMHVYDPLTGQLTLRFFDAGNTLLDEVTTGDLRPFVNGLVQTGGVNPGDTTTLQFTHDGVNVDDPIIIQPGAAGAPGRDGTDGRDGAQGLPGRDGTNGSPIDGVVDEGIDSSTGGRVIDFTVNGTELNTPVVIPRGGVGPQGTAGEDGFELQTATITAGSPVAGQSLPATLTLTGLLNGVSTTFDATFTIPPGAPGTHAEAIDGVVDEGIDPSTGGRIIDFTVGGVEINTPVTIPAGPTGGDGRDGYDASISATSTATGVDITTDSTDPAINPMTVSLAQGVVTNTNIQIQRTGTVDSAAIVGGQIQLTLSDHSGSTSHDTPAPVASVAPSATQTYPGTGTLIYTVSFTDRHNLFNYVIDNITVEAGDGSFFPATADYGTNSVRVTKDNPGTATLRATLTATHATDGATTQASGVFTLTALAPPGPDAPPYYTFTQENAIPDNVAQDLSTYVSHTEGLTDGDFVTLNRPAGVAGNFFGAIAIRTTGQGALTIVREDSFDGGTSLPDVSTATPIGVANAGDYTVYIFPLHLTRNRIQIN